MMKLTIEKLQKIVDGQLIAITDRDVLIKDIIIDSRKITAGALFVALAGEKFDGHQFVKQSFNAGALLALVEHPIDSTLPQIVVRSTHRALGLIAKWFREQSQAQFIALTGSSGKTSVKEMTA
ncbi:Mur ligase domain-containing protein, partial [Frischella perrara]